MVTSMAGLSVANYVLAVVLVYVFAVKLGWLPAIYTNNTGTPGELIKSLTLPALSIGIPLFCFYTRLLRADILEQMQGEDYVVTAKAKGVGPWRVLVRHALPNSLFGLLTIVALNLGTLIGATVIIEQIFAVPGIGHSLLEAINNRDVPVVEGIVLVLAVVVVLANLLADVLYARPGPEDQVWPPSCLRPKPTLAMAPPPPSRAASRRGWTRSLDLVIPGAMIAAHPPAVLRVAAVRDRADADRRQHPRRQHLRRSPPGTRSAPTRSATTSGRGCSTAGATRWRSRSPSTSSGSCSGACSAPSPRIWGSFTDTVIMRILDVLIAFPSLVLALAIAQSLGAEQAAHDLRAVLLQRAGLRAAGAGRDPAPARAAVHARRAAGGHAGAADPAAPRRAEHRARSSSPSACSGSG